MIRVWGVCDVFFCCFVGLFLVSRCFLVVVSLKKHIFKAGRPGEAWRCFCLFVIMFWPFCDSMVKSLLCFFVEGRSNRRCFCVVVCFRFIVFGFCLILFRGEGKAWNMLFLLLWLWLKQIYIPSNACSKDRFDLNGETNIEKCLYISVLVVFLCVLYWCLLIACLYFLALVCMCC